MTFTNMKGTIESEKVNTSNNHDSIPMSCKVIFRSQKRRVFSTFLEALRVRERKLSILYRFPDDRHCQASFDHWSHYLGQAFFKTVFGISRTTFLTLSKCVKFSDPAADEFILVEKQCFSIADLPGRATSSAH